MRYTNIYNELIGCKNEEEVFNYLISTLKPSTIAWSYFVNWEKVFKNIKEIEVSLNLLNYLIGKEDFDSEFKYLIKKHPEIIKVIPALVVRDGKNTNDFKILVDHSNKKMVYEDYNFSINNPTDEDVNKYLTFIEKTGLKKLLLSKKIKNLVDYMIGVEAGLDSNARKNRGGTQMEDIVNCFIQDICKRNNLSYLKEANAKEIKKEFNKDVPVDKSSRRYDFVIFNGKDISLIEVNFYSGGGSKLKATAGEYKTLHDLLKNNNKFIWITDGIGWETTKRPLRETFDHNEYVINLDMIEKGILENIILKNE